MLQLEARLTSKMKCAYFADEGLPEQANIEMSKLKEDEKSTHLHHGAPILYASTAYLFAKSRSALATITGLPGTTGIIVRGGWVELCSWGDGKR